MITQHEGALVATSGSDRKFSCEITMGLVLWFKFNNFGATAFAASSLFEWFFGVEFGLGGSLIGSGLVQVTLRG